MAKSTIGSQLRLYHNGDTLNTNYQWKLAATGGNDARIDNTTAVNGAGHFWFQGGEHLAGDIAAGIHLKNIHGDVTNDGVVPSMAWHHWFSINPITTIRLNSSLASIKPGTRIVVWGLD
uniref:Uncharacterized protein n=1 Tax=viral metagenome TaxID=1070528 RepID=A0A2V0RHJ9_9ZZZZ